MIAFDVVSVVFLTPKQVEIPVVVERHQEVPVHNEGEEVLNNSDDADDVDLNRYKEDFKDGSG